jgi:2,4-dienoyl-CoA reductase (NADPH2)
MSASLAASQRGHEVVLFEKTNKLGGGGQFWLSTIPPFKKELFYIPEYYEREFAELKNLKIHFNTEVNTKTVLQEKPDAVIVATGASVLIPDIPGSNDPAVLTYEDVLLEKKTVGSHAIIIGGGNVGCETALYLIKKGVRVTILEMCFRMLDNVEHSTRNTLLKELKEGGAEMIEKAVVISITKNEATYLKEGNGNKIQGDTIVLAVGSKPEDHLYYALNEKLVNIHIAGDAKEPRQIMHAVSEGFYAAYYL